MATGIKNGIEITGGQVGKFFCVCQSLLCRTVLRKPPGCRSLEIGLITLRIERRLAAFGRSQNNVRSGVPENIVGGGKLFRSEAGLFTGIPELIVRSQNRQNTHVGLLGSVRVNL